MPAPKSKYKSMLALLACLALHSSLADDTIRVPANDDQQRFLAEAESLLSAGQSNVAFTFLSTRESELAGSPLFDYLLGVAALDSGRTAEAIFSLRRALVSAPAFSGARMELARAYYDSGNNALARPLFLRLLDEQPPTAVRGVINDYIAAIDEASALPKSTVQTSYDVAVGHDSNANGSTNNQQFMGFTLSPVNLATESTFVELGAGVTWIQPKSTRFGYYASGRAGYRRNPDADFVDSAILSGNGGMNWQRGRFFGRAGLNAYWATRDGDPNQNYAGLDLLVGNRVSDSWELTAGLRSGALRHDDAIEILDVDRLMVSVGASHRLGTGGNIGIELLGGSDSERTAGSPYGNSKFGGRVSLYQSLSDGNNLVASAGSLDSDYDGLFFGTSRKDKQVSLSLQLSFRDVWIEGLSLNPGIRYIDNDSNVSLYKYDRTEIGLQLRWISQ